MKHSTMKQSTHMFLLFLVGLFFVVISGENTGRDCKSINDLKVCQTSTPPDWCTDKELKLCSDSSEHERGLDRSLDCKDFSDQITTCVWEFLNIQKCDIRKKRTCQDLIIMYHNDNCAVDAIDVADLEKKMNSHCKKQCQRLTDEITDGVEKLTSRSCNLINNKQCEYLIIVYKDRKCKVENFNVTLFEEKVYDHCQDTKCSDLTVQINTCGDKLEKSLECDLRAKQECETIIKSYKNEGCEYRFAVSAQIRLDTYCKAVNCSDLSKEITYCVNLITKSSLCDINELKKCETQMRFYIERECNVYTISVEDKNDTMHSYCDRQCDTLNYKIHECVDNLKSVECNPTEKRYCANYIKDYNDNACEEDNAIEEKMNEICQTIKCNNLNYEIIDCVNRFVGFQYCDYDFKTRCELIIENHKNETCPNDTKLINIEYQEEKMYEHCRVLKCKHLSKQLTDYIDQFTTTARCDLHDEESCEELIQFYNDEDCVVDDFDVLYVEKKMNDYCYNNTNHENVRV